VRLLLLAPPGAGKGTQGGPADQLPETVTADIQARLAGLTRVAGR
jgi:hypothetical protein